MKDRYAVFLTSGFGALIIGVTLASAVLALQGGKSFWVARMELKGTPATMQPAPARIVESQEFLGAVADRVGLPVSSLKGYIKAVPVQGGTCLAAVGRTRAQAESLLTGAFGALRARLPELGNPEAAGAPQTEPVGLPAGAYVVAVLLSLFAGGALSAALFLLLRKAPGTVRRSIERECTKSGATGGVTISFRLERRTPPPRFRKPVVMITPSRRNSLRALSRFVQRKAG